MQKELILGVFYGVCSKNEPVNRLNNFVLDD